VVERQAAEDSFSRAALNPSMNLRIPLLTDA
jgi:hypothetical protein